MKLKIFHDTRSHLVWAVRLVEKGDNYGLKDCLTNSGETLVEFFDTRYEHTDIGQFAGRYYMKTLLGVDGGVNLDNGVKDWSVGAACMSRVRDWLRRQA